MSWKIWQSTAWDSNAQTSSNWGSTNWATPEKKKKKNTWTDQQWDYASPTGVPYVEGLPEEFKPNKKYLDSNEVYGKTMLRCVSSTSWAAKYRLAGRELADLRLVDLLWRGWRNHHLRALSHGQYVSLVIARKVNESVLMSQFLSSLREQRWDLDDVSNEYCRQHPDQVTLKSSMSSDEVKAAKTLAVANFLVEALRPYAVEKAAASSSDQSQVIADLQAQLKAEKAKNSASDPPAMELPAKRVRLGGKTALPIQSVTDPTQQIVDRALDPDSLISEHIFQQHPTQGVAKANIAKWLKNVKSKVGPDKAESIDKAIALAKQRLAQLDPTVIQQLRDKCAQISLPVQWATKIKEPEIHQVLIAATCAAD